MGSKLCRVNGVPIVVRRSSAAGFDGWVAYRADRNGRSNVYRQPEAAVRCLLGMYDRPHMGLMRRVNRALAHA
jgi:hypothetical protein